MEALFLTTRWERPSYRFRAEQFYPLFTAAGIRCHGGLLPNGHWDRWRFLRSLSRYDLVVVQQRLMHPLELRLLRSAVRTLVYDVDDAVMLAPDGRTTRRRAQRFQRMVELADLVVCGNQYLVDHARALGAVRVALIPTAVDSSRFCPSAAHEPLNECSREDRDDESVTIGWTGSGGTNHYLAELLPVLDGLSGAVRLKIISDRQDRLELHQLQRIPSTFIPWSAEREVRETAEFDIGLMPLPDNPWTRGKCGCKALQYMSLAIPAVCSPVGVNREIISDGIDGFLPASHNQWAETLQSLIHDAGLRRRIGVAGRERVLDAYSVDVVGRKLVDSILDVTRSGEKSCAVSAAS